MLFSAGGIKRSCFCAESWVKKRAEQGLPCAIAEYDLLLYCQLRMYTLCMLSDHV
jgi:hypothetical protein